MIVNQHHSLLIALLFFWGSLSAHAKLREFTNTEGQTIQAELVSAEEGERGLTVTLRRADGRTFDVAVTLFSKEDQRYIRKWWEDLKKKKQILHAEVDLEISLKMNPKSKGLNDDYWYDRNMKRFAPEVTITNDDFYQDYTGNKVRVVMFAEDRRYRERLLVVSVTDLEIDFPANETVVKDAKPFFLEHTEYDYTDYEYGYLYDGYAIVISNSEGEVTHTKCSSKAFDDNVEILLKCKRGEVYSDDLEHLVMERASSYYWN